MQMFPNDQSADYQCHSSYQLPLVLNLAGPSKPPCAYDMPVLFDQEELVMLSEVQINAATPRNVNQMLFSEQKECWIRAMNREKACHVKNKTFGDVCITPAKVKPIPADWIFKMKHRGEAESFDVIPANMYKARIVLRGQYMKAGLDYNDAFSPVAKTTTIRAVLALAVKKNMDLFSGDIETAFLTPDIDTEIWVSMPPLYGNDDGEINEGSKSERQVRKLLKGVPGIPQGGKLFYDKFSGVLLECGFTQSAADKCLFLKEFGGVLALCIIWVDDFLFACHGAKVWNIFLKDLKRHFNVTGGELHEFLGLRFVRDRPLLKMSITQESMIVSMLEKSGLSSANAVPVPCANGFVFTRADSPKSAEEKDAMEKVNQGPTPFRQRSALIKFSVLLDPPGCTFTVNKLSKFMSNPGAVHWAGLNYLIKYLKGTKGKGLLYDFSSASEVQGLHGFTDASYADCPDSSKSTLGYVFYYDSAPISWYSKLHSFVTTSTNHSEYAALALGAKEAYWLAQLFQEIDPSPPKPLLPVPVYGDSSGVIALVFNPVEHQANKHIRVADHYARELTKEGVIAPHRVASELNKADCFTKPLQATNFKRAAAWMVVMEYKLRNRVDVFYEGGCSCE